MSAELAEVISSVSTAGATTLVTAMASDTWNAVRDRVVRLLNRTDSEKEPERLASLNEIHDAVVQHPEGDLSQQRERLRELLKEAILDDFQVAEELLALIREIRQDSGIRLATGHQYATAADQAQQAVQYSGTQTNTFHQGTER